MRTLFAIAVVLAVALLAAAGVARAETRCHSEYLTDDIPYRWKIVCKGWW